jgi:hypothetical protein
MAYKAIPHGRWSGCGFLLVVTVPVLFAATSPARIAPSHDGAAGIAQRLATVSESVAYATASDSLDEQGDHAFAVRGVFPHPFSDITPTALTRAAASGQATDAAPYGSSLRAPPG